jgi:hypothetical protein
MIMKQHIFILILFAIFPVSAAAQNRQIEEIRRIYRETGEKIKTAEKAFAAAEKDGGIAETEIFLTEMNFNKGNTSYPAVGFFREETKFYFTFGAGENPYPNKLLKIVTTTHRSAAVEHREYFFNPVGQMIFYFEDPDAENMDKTEETRIYFSNGKLIRFQVGDDLKTDSPIFRRKNEIVQEILEKQKKLMNIFNNSL